MVYNNYGDLRSPEKKKKEKVLDMTVLRDDKVFGCQ